MTKKVLAVCAVVVAVMAAAGTAVGATRYVITSLSQISPTVVKQLHGATGPRGPAGPAGQGAAYVANGSVDALAKTATTVATLALPKAPAFVQATVTITNSGTPGDATATCVLDLAGKAIAPAVTIDSPAWLTPLNNPGTSSATLFAPVTTRGTVTLDCLDVADSGTLAAQGSLAALTTATAALVAAPTPTATASATPVPSSTATPAPSSSATATATPSASSTSTPSPSASSSSGPLPVPLG